MHTALRYLSFQFHHSARLLRGQLDRRTTIDNDILTVEEGRPAIRDVEHHVRDLERLADALDNMGLFQILQRPAPSF